MRLPFGAICIVVAATIDNAADADSICEVQRPLAERSHDCIEFADRRFRIPSGYFGPWAYVDTTDPSKRVRFRFPSGKTEEGYFFFVATLPDLLPSRELTEIRKIPGVDFETYKRMGGTEAQPGVLAVVQRRENSRLGLRMERHAERWVFADSLVQNLLAKACRRIEAAHPDPLAIRCPRGDAYQLHRVGERISHVLIDAPGFEGYVCQMPYSEGIYLSISVTAEHRGEICAIGQRMRDKLRSFEY